MASQGLWAGDILSLFVAEGPCLLHSLFRCLFSPKDGLKEIQTNPACEALRSPYQCSLGSIDITDKHP